MLYIGFIRICSVTGNGLRSAQPRRSVAQPERLYMTAIFDRSHRINNILTCKSCNVLPVTHSLFGTQETVNTQGVSTLELRLAQRVLR